MNMRATWITSAVAGASFGVFASLVKITRVPVDGAAASKYVSLTLGIGLCVVGLFCVIGSTQLRDINAKRRSRGILMDIKLEDVAAFLVPVWGRMLVWFITAGAAALVVKAIWNAV